MQKRKPAVSSRFGYLFQSARRNLPADLPEDWKATGYQGPKDFHLSVDTGEAVPKSATALFFPLHPNQVENAPPQVFHASGTSFQLTLKRSDQLLKGLETLEGLVVLKDKKSQKCYWVAVPLSGQ